jgi:hypothetical protein
MFKRFLTAPGSKTNPPRLRIEFGPKHFAFVDGKGYEIRKKQIADFLQALLDAKGGYVTLESHDLRSRDIDGLPHEIRDLIETKQRVGCRLLPSCFQ